VIAHVIRMYVWWTFWASETFWRPGATASTDIPISGVVRFGKNIGTVPTPKARRTRSGPVNICYNKRTASYTRISHERVRRWSLCTCVLQRVHDLIPYDERFQLFVIHHRHHVEDDYVRDRRSQNPDCQTETFKHAPPKQYHTII